MEKFLLVNVPTLLLAVLTVTVALGLSISGLLLVRRSVALSTLERHNDVAGFIIAVVGVLYAVLLAFVVVITWQNFDRASQIASQEAQLVEGLYRDASVFGAQGVELRNTLDAYATSVVTREWPAMDVHQDESAATDAALERVFAAYHAVDPKTPTEQAFYGESIRRLEAVEAARGDRIEAASAQLPSVLWGVLGVGGLI